MSVANPAAGGVFFSFDRRACAWQWSRPFAGGAVRNAHPFGVHANDQFDRMTT